MSKVKMEINEKGLGTIIVDGVELETITSYSIKQSALELPKVNISIIPTMGMATYENAIVNYDFVISLLPNDELLKLYEKVNEEIKERGI